MRNFVAAIAIMMGVTGAAGAQEKGREAKAAEPTMSLKDVDTNKDGKVTIAELQAALEKLKQRAAEGGDKKEGGDRPAAGEKREGDDRKEGGDKKEGGDRKKKE